MNEIHPKIFTDEAGEPKEVLISWEEYRDLVESSGLDLEPEVLKQLRQSKADRSRKDFSAYVSIDETIIVGRR